MLKDILWPPHRRFKSRTEWEPVGFFSECLCNSIQFDLMLGFFSSTAISVLSDSFASFLYGKGRMRLIINDILTEQDRQIILSGASTKDIPFFDISDLARLKQTLSERDTHFFDCLTWLIRNNRLEIKIISPIDPIGISHTKSGIFYDGNNFLSFEGSCNFSRTALVNNIESLTVSCGWDGDIEKAKIENMKDDFETVFQGKSESVFYINAENIKTDMINTFNNKEINELLIAEYKYLSSDLKNRELPKTIIKALDKAKNRVQEEIEKYEIKKNEITTFRTDSLKPSFPYLSGPRDYQINAFECWKNNKQKGLFAMATGTGKTITSLNCLLEVYKQSGYYKALILVPTITLVDQWEEECIKFNFNNIVKVSSKSQHWKSNIGNLRMIELSKTDDKLSYIIIATYASFVRSNIFPELIKFPKNKLLLIADEVHNMGSGQMINRLNEIPYLRRIGLSATPERQYDESGNQKLMNFFGCSDNFTFQYLMAEAIEKGALCRYYYYPHIVRLTGIEMEQYVKISKQIVKIMGFKDTESQEILQQLLLKRKRIIHKAENKKTVFKTIIQNRMLENKSLKYTLVYVPEGTKPDNNESDIFDKSDMVSSDEDSTLLIDIYTRIVRDIDSHIVVRQFTSDSTDRDYMLKNFSSGNIDVLTSMKCLDEGVDLPRSELAIFCSSTGNPRQFIQRRGRVLRKHKDKNVAYIHDLVVVPDTCANQNFFELEKNLVGAELKRVRDFALLSENLFDTEREMINVLNKYNLSIFN